MQLGATFYIFPVSTPDFPPECLVLVDLEVSSLPTTPPDSSTWRYRTPFRRERVTAPHAHRARRPRRSINPFLDHPNRDRFSHALNMRSPPPEVVASWPRPNYVNPETRGPDLIVAGVITLVFAVVCLAMRMYVRLRIMRKTELDDWVMVVATVRQNHHSTCSSPAVSMSRLVLEEHPRLILFALRSSSQWLPPSASSSRLIGTAGSTTCGT